jgi:putative SOS response-associated peptidase YedK
MPRVATEPETRVGMLLLASKYQRTNRTAINAARDSTVLLTTGPNAVTSAIPDRMPVILDPDAYDLWLDPGMKDVGAASGLLKPYDARLMRCYPVSTRINHVANDDAECSAPVELAQIQSSLFL